MGRESMAGAFFLLAHDEFSGRARCDLDLLRCGVVGAQLAELVIGGRLGVVDGRVHPLDAEAVGETPAASYVMECILAQPRHHTVRTWTDSLGEPLFELVARQLTDDKVVRRDVGRGVGRRRADRFPAVDLLRAAAPRSRLSHAVSSPRNLDLAGAFTIALVWALGLASLLDQRIERSTADELILRIRARMPGALRELLEGVDSTAAASSLSVRR